MRSHDRRSSSVSLWRTLRVDAERDGASSVPAALLRAFGTVRFQAVVLVRVAAAMQRVSPVAASMVKYLNSVLTGCDVAAAARIGPGLRLYHPTGVVIGPDVVIGANCTVQQHATLGYGGSGSPKVHDDVVIGPGAVVMGALTIGRGARVGANAVVTKDIAPYELWAGVPARFLRRMPAPGE